MADSTAEVRQVLRLNVDADGVGSLALWGDRYGYTTGAEAVVCALSGSEPPISVDRGRDGWAIGTLVGDRTTVVWTRFRPVGDGPQLEWEILTRELPSGPIITIAHQRPFNERFFTVPVPSLEWPFVVWSQLPESGDIEHLGPNVASYDLRTKDVRVVAGGMFPEEPGVSNGLVFFSGRTNATTTRDLYMANADGSSPIRRVTSLSNEYVTDVRVGDGSVVWRVHPKDPDKPVGDLPIWVAPASTVIAAKLVAEGVRGVPGTNFVVVGADELQSFWTPAKSPPKRVGGAGYALIPEWTTSGRHIAFVEVSDYLGARDHAAVYVVELLDG